ncbi:uncharacterized protein LOC143830649 [Paroedura picta]|uniref:uncharacterized protein LOC143830649 n=1 Tax=Paroedura picta TaxID=143630 RepID=UPI0040568327
MRRYSYNDNTISQTLEQQAKKDQFNNNLAFRALKSCKKQEKKKTWIDFLQLKFPLLPRSTGSCIFGSHPQKHQGATMNMLDLPNTDSQEQRSSCYPHNNPMR